MLYYVCDRTPHEIFCSFVRNVDIMFETTSIDKGEITDPTTMTFNRDISSI